MNSNGPSSSRATGERINFVAYCNVSKVADGITFFEYNDWDRISRMGHLVPVLSPFNSRTRKKRTTTTTRSFPDWSASKNFKPVPSSATSWMQSRKKKPTTNTESTEKFPASGRHPDQLRARRCGGHWPATSNAATDRPFGCRRRNWIFTTSTNKLNFSGWKSSVVAATNRTKTNVAKIKTIEVNKNLTWSNGNFQHHTSIAWWKVLKDSWQFAAIRTPTLSTKKIDGKKPPGILEFPKTHT